MPRGAIDRRLAEMVESSLVQEFGGGYIAPQTNTNVFQWTIATGRLVCLRYLHVMMLRTAVASPVQNYEMRFHVIVDGVDKTLAWIQGFGNLVGDRVEVYMDEPFIIGSLVANDVIFRCTLTDGSTGGAINVLGTMVLDTLTTRTPVSP